VDYKDYARETETTLPTGIHTRINNDLRISSCFKRFSNPHFESWAWETFLWNGERIEQEYITLNSADQVVDLHTRIIKDIHIK
jgi:hypothetical protein